MKLSILKHKQFLLLCSSFLSLTTCVNAANIENDQYNNSLHVGGAALNTNSNEYKKMIRKLSDEDRFALAIAESLKEETKKKIPAVTGFNENSDDDISSKYSEIYFLIDEDESEEKFLEEIRGFFPESTKNKMWH